jgi:hypothetical protein
MVFEQISFYFHFNHSDVRIEHDVSFRSRNKSKIRPKKRIGFVHIDITTLVLLPVRAKFIWQTTSSNMQCCEGAEISAAELKRGPAKICTLEKLAPISLNMPKRGRPFLKMKKCKLH